MVVSRTEIDHCLNCDHDFNFDDQFGHFESAMVVRMIIVLDKGESQPEYIDFFQYDENDWICR